MAILVFGSSGQLAQSLRDTQQGGESLFLDRIRCDLADPDQVDAILERQKPGVIINAAAYTAVDKAEEEPGLLQRRRELRRRRRGARVRALRHDDVWHSSCVPVMRRLARTRLRVR